MNWFRKHKSLALLAVAALAVSAVSLMVPAALSRASTPRTPAAVPATPPPHWIIHESVIKQLLTDNLMKLPQLQKLFDNKQTYIIYEQGDTTQILTDAIATVAYTSVTQQLQPAIKNHTLPAWAQAVLYDNERWSMTPANPEQHQPDKYMAIAAQLVHKAGLKFIAAPAPDLTTTILGPGYHGSPGCLYPVNYCGYLVPLKLAHYAAVHSDVIDIQGQQIQPPYPGHFTSFVQAAAAQARAANPNVIIMEGLTTNPKDTINATMLEDAYKVVRPYVQGYWLNVSAQQPKMAAAFLKWVITKYP